MDTPMAAFMKQLLDEYSTLLDNASISSDPGCALKPRKRRTPDNLCRACRWSSIPMKDTSMDDKSDVTYSMVRRSSSETATSSSAAATNNRKEHSPKKPVRKVSSKGEISLMRMMATSLPVATGEYICEQTKLDFPRLPKRSYSGNNARN